MSCFLSHPNLTQNLCTLFFVLPLALLPHLYPFQTSPTVSPWESASVFTDYLRSHFSVSQPKALRSRARGYLIKLRQTTCTEESHSSFCFPFSPAELLAAASNLTSSPAAGRNKVTYRMLKHLPLSGMDFLFHIFNFSLSWQPFPSIWKTSSIFPIHNMGKPLDSLASFRSTSLISSV